MNHALIQSLFGTPAPQDVVFLDGSENPSASAITAKLAAIPEGTSPNFYLHSANETYFNDSLMRYFSNAKFTILGLEAVTKGALKKILKSLPLTVTTIGIASLKEIPFEYLQSYLNRIKKSRNIEVIVGDNVHTHSTDQELPQNKRKLNSTNIVVATKLAKNKKHKSNNSGKSLSELTETIEKLERERDELESIINRDPEGRYVLILKARVKEAEDKVEAMSETIRQLQSQLQEASQQTHEIMSVLNSPKTLTQPGFEDFTSGFMLHSQPPELLSAPPSSHGLLQFDTIVSPYRQSPYGASQSPYSASHSIFSNRRPIVPTSLPLMSPHHPQCEHHLGLNAITQSGTGAVSVTNSTGHPEQDVVHHFLR